MIKPLYFLGPINYYSMLVAEKNLEFAKYETFEKQTLRNRFNIAGANGLQTLTIHVEKSVANAPICDIKISHTERWQENMLRTLKTSYGKAPFFEFYDYKLFPVLEQKHTFIWDWSLELLHLSLDLLKIDLEIEESQNPIHLIKQENSTSIEKVYRQTFAERTGFITNLSIIDLIFNTGPNAIDFILPHES